MKGILIKANGVIQRINLPGSRTPSLGKPHDLRRLLALQRTLGGFIESINLGDTGHWAYINEDGMALRLPYNKKATALCHKYNTGLMHDDFIKGSMVIVGPPDDNGNETDVNKDLAIYLLSV